VQALTEGDRVRMSLIEMCKKHDFLVAEIKKRTLAQSCPPDMLELTDARRALAKDIAELVRKYLNAIAGRFVIPALEEGELLYFNTWFNLHRFAEET
jgi:hypothetical protein